MTELAIKLSVLSDWLSVVQPNPNLTLLVVGLCFFVFGLSRRKSP